MVLLYHRFYEPIRRCVFGVDILHEQPQMNCSTLGWNSAEQCLQLHFWLEDSDFKTPNWSFSSAVASHTAVCGADLRAHCWSSWDGALGNSSTLGMKVLQDGAPPEQSLKNDTHQKLIF